jgi:DNA-binding ferritin-like protein
LLKRYWLHIAIAVVLAACVGAFMHRGTVIVKERARADKAEQALKQLTKDYADISNRHQAAIKLAEEGAKLATDQQIIVDAARIDAANASAAAIAERNRRLREQANLSTRPAVDLAAFSAALARETTYRGIAERCGELAAEGGAILVGSLSVAGQAQADAERNAAIAASAQSDATTCRKATRDEAWTDISQQHT